MKTSVRPRARSILAGLVVLAIVVVAVVVISGGGSSTPVTTSTTTTTTPAPPPPQRLFSATSVWNAPLSTSAAIDPASPALIQAFDAEVATEQSHGIGPWITTGKASTPIYVVPRTQPTVHVALDVPTLWWRRALARAFQAVPIPPNAQPATGQDAHMTVWQPSTNTLWEFFHMRKEADGWHAGWGGAIRNVSQSPGYFTSAAWPGALPQWGATATSLPVAAGVITLADLRSGSIDHALALDLPAPRQGVFAFPAQRSDGTGGPTTIPEGGHLRLDPSLNLSSLKMPPLTRMIAQAAQRYGLVVRDQTHSGISMFAEIPQSSAGGQVYYARDGFFHGESPLELLRSFPWSHLEVLQMHLCTRAPCQA